MRIVATSDTHGNHPDPKTVPDGDVFVHCGDFTNYGRPGEIARFAAWLRELPHEHKLVIPGNHDLSFEDKTATDADLGDGVTLLIDQQIVINGKTFYGSPWTPRFGDWAFMYDHRIADYVWKLIPDNTDVLITHGPSFGVLDKTIYRENAGCVALNNRVFEVKPKLHLHGHIHEARGEQVLACGTLVANCAVGGRVDLPFFVGDL